MSGLKPLRGSKTVALFVVAAAIFTDMLVYGLIVPILPGYASTLGASQSAIGLLFGSYAISLLVTTPFLGILSDRIGRKIPMLAGLFGLAAATLLFAFADNFALLVVARLLQGVSAAATWTAGLALLADMFPSETRGKSMGSALAGMSIGSLVGPPLGGLLFEWGGYKLPFLVAVSFAVLDAVAQAVLLTEPVRQAEKKPVLIPLLRNRMVMATIGAVALGIGAMSLLEPTLPLYLQNRLGTSPGIIGLLFGVSTLSYSVSAPLSGWLSDRWSRRTIMVTGLAAMAVVFPVMGMLNSLVLEAAAMVAFGITLGLMMAPTMPALADIMDNMGSNSYATAYSIFNFAYALGMMAGPLAGGMMTESFGFIAALVITMAALLLYIPVLLAGTRKKAPHL